MLKPGKGIGLLLLIVLSIPACQPVTQGGETPAIPTNPITAKTIAPTSTQVPSTPTPTYFPSSTPVPTSTETPTLTPTHQLTPTRPTSTPIKFPEDIYKPPLPLQFGAWPATSGCPNHEGLQEAVELPVDTVIYGVSELLFTGNRLREKAVSDPALWPLLPFPRSERGDQHGIDETWIESIRKVDQTEYAKLVPGQCGSSVADITWVAKICPGPCESNTFESLKDDLFFINRNDHWLIWAIY